MFETTIELKCVIQFEFNVEDTTESVVLEIKV